MSIWQRWFGKGQGPDPDNDEGTPTLERTKSAALPPDTFDDVQHVLGHREEYRRAAEFARAKTFVEKFRWVKNASSAGILFGHLVSGASMLGFTALAAWNWTNVEAAPTLANWGVFGLALVSIATCVVLLELAKIRNEGQLFEALALGRRLRRAMLGRVIALVLGSLTISAGGSYMAGLWLSDNSAQIESSYQGDQVQLVNTYRADSLAAEKSFSERLARDQKTVSDWNDQVKDLRGEKVFWQGKWVMPERNRKPANLLVQRISEKEAEISRYREDHRQEMKGLKSSRNSEAIVLTGKLEQDLATDMDQATRYAWIAVIICFSVEVLSLLSHGAKTRYWRGVFLEAKATGMIPKTIARDRITVEALMATFYREQAEQLATDLQDVQQFTGTHPGQAPSNAAGYHQNLKNQVGPIDYKQPLASQQPGDQTGRLFEELQRMREELARLQNPPREIDSKSGKDSPGGIHTFHREIDIDNSHPQFTEKVQPDTYRGIDEKKYRRLVRAAEKQLAQSGKYNKSKLASAAGITRPSVAKYLKIAFQRNDLNP